MKLLACALIVVTLATVLPVPCYAQPVINPKALPAGVTEKDAAAIAASTRKQIRALLNARVAERKAILDKVDAVLASWQKKLQEQASTSQDYKSFLAATEKIGTSAAADRIAAVKEAYAKSKDLMGFQIRESGADPQKLAETILALFGKDDVKFLRVPDQPVAFIGRRDTTSIGKVASKNIFNSPYLIQDTDMVKEGVGTIEVSAAISKTNAQMKLHAYAGGGGHASASGTVTCLIDVPAGKTSLIVRVMYDFSYNVNAWSFNAQSSTAKAQAVVSVFEISGGAAAQVRHGDLFPPVSVFAEVGIAESAENVTRYLEITPFPVTAGKRYAVCLTLDADAYGALQAFGTSDVTLTPKAIEIEFR